MSTVTGMSQQEVLHYYVKIKASTKSDIVSHSYGQVIRNDNNKVTLQPLPVADAASMVEHMTQEIGDRPHDMLLYIHGMWANNPMVWKQTAEVIEDQMIDRSSNRQVIFSFIWDGAIIYQNSVAQACKSGESSSEIFGLLTDPTDGRRAPTLIAHSMGNRFFQHMVAPFLTDETVRLHHYFVMAGDIEHNIFAKNQPLENIGNIVENITIYKHNNDRTLMLSKLLNKNERIGLYGLDEETAAMQLWTEVDASLTADNQVFGKDLFNHRYYYTNSDVIADVRASLHNIANPRRQELDGPRHLMLVPSEQ